MSPVANAGLPMGEYMLALPEAEHAPLARYLPDPAAELPAPYRGISAFRLGDAPIFFARGDLIVQLTRSVAVYRGVLLYGESGVGKSSLINAGFIPASIRQGYQPERLRVRPVAGAEILVERISVSPDGGAPCLPSLFATGDEAPTLSADALVTRMKSLRPGERPLLIFDQFEECVTLFEEAPQTGASGDSSAAEAALKVQGQLFDAIVALVSDHRIPVKVVLSFREDYLAKLSRLLERVPGLSDQYVRVVAPRADQLETIVRGPLRHFTTTPDGEERTSERAELARQMLKMAPALEEEFRKRVGPGALVLTEVQIACSELWNSPEREHLLKSGIQKILERFLDRAVNDYRREDLRDAAVALLAGMVTDSGTRNIVSENSLLRDVEKETKVGRDQLMEILKDFDGRKTRLVRREEPRGIPFYTIVSEFLVPRIRAWRVNREQERRLARLFRRMALGAGILAVLVVAGFYVYDRNQRAAIREADLRASLADSARVAATARAERDSAILAAAADREQAARTRSQLDSATAISNNAVARADALAAAGIQGQEALNAERTARAQLETTLQFARARLDTLEVANSRSIAVAASLRGVVDSLSTQTARLQGERDGLLLARVERDTLRGTRESVMQIVREALNSRDSEEEHLARRICAADRWHCERIGGTSEPQTQRRTP